MKKMPDSMSLVLVPIESYMSEDLVDDIHVGFDPKATVSEMRGGCWLVQTQGGDFIVKVTIEPKTNK